MARRSTSRQTTSPKQIRSALRGISSIEDIFGGGETGNLMQGHLSGDPEVHAWFQKRHLAGGNLVCDEEGYYRRNGHEWKIPYGVKVALKTELYHAQIVHRYPWYVTWVSPKTGKRLKKYFMSLARAVEFVAEKAQYVDPHASVVCRHGMDIPPKLRNKLPSPWKWCPGCMAPRKFYRVYPEQTFYALIKVWNEEKGRYEFKDRGIPLLCCKVCGWTNREGKYRRSNQKFELRKVKKGVRRVKRRHRSQIRRR